MTPCADVMAQVHAAANREDRAWSVAEFASLVAAPGAVVTGDDRNFVLGRVILDEAEVLTLATDPRHQRLGLARAALAEFHRLATAMGATRAFLEVAEDNTTALALYLSAGYRQTGRRPGYYVRAGGPRAAALTLARSLPDAAS